MFPRLNLVLSTICLPLLLVAGLHPALAQEARRDLTGVVHDDHSEPLRGAVVYVEEDISHVVVTYLTDKSGAFSFKRLRSDLDYEVWAMYRGQESKRKTLSQFDRHPAPTINLVIHPR